MKLRIAYITMYYYPEITSSLHLTQDLINDLSDEMVEVELITATPSRNIDRDSINKYRNLRYENIENRNISIHRLKVVNESKKSIQRIIRYITYSIKVFFKLLKLDCNIISVGSTPPLILAYSCLLAGKIKKIPVVLRLQDLFPETAIKSGSLKNKWIISICNKLEAILYEHVSGIITIGEDMKSKIVRILNDDKKVYVVPNWIDEEKVKEVHYEENRFISNFKIDTNKFNVLFAGNLGLAQDIEIIIKAAEMLQKHEHIQFIIVGDGVKKSKIEEIIKDKKLNNVLLYPMQSQELVPDVYSTGDVGFVTLKKGVIGNAIPSKTATIMSCSRPIIATVDEGSDYYKFINNNEIGIAVDSENVEQLVSAIKELYKNEEKRVKYGNNARVYVEQKLGRKYQTKKYAKILEKILIK